MELDLIVGFDETATKASPQLMTEARGNLRGSTSHCDFFFFFVFFEGHKDEIEKKIEFRNVHRQQVFF